MAENDFPRAKNSPEWWQQYFRPFFRRSNIYLQLPPKPTFLAYLLPLTIFALTVFACVYWLYSNEYFIEHTLSKAEINAKTIEARERIEHTREGMSYILKNPAFRLLLSAEYIFTVVKSLLSFLFFTWLLLSALSGKWQTFLSFWLLSSSSLSMLTIGVFVNSVLKIVLLREVVAVGPLLFFNSYELADEYIAILAQFDFFLIWYFGLLSLRLSSLYQEKSSTVFVLCISCWSIIVLLFRIILHANWTLTLN